MDEPNEGINFDGVFSDDLLLTPQEIFAQYFPNRPFDEEVARALHNYAQIKHEAMLNRVAGKIKHALKCEAACDMVYRGLPEWARW